MSAPCAQCYKEADGLPDHRIKPNWGYCAHHVTLLKAELEHQKQLYEVCSQSRTVLTGTISELKEKLKNLQFRYDESNTDRTRLSTVIGKEMSKHYRPIEYVYQHDNVLKRIEKLWEAKEGTHEYFELQILALMVARYEQKEWPIEPPTKEMMDEFLKDQGIIK